MGGGQEPPEWPSLVVADGDGLDYVTDRFLMIRADLAPVPDDYEGVVIPGRPNASDLLASLAGISTERPVGRHFHWSTLKALELTGWDLRVLHGSDKRVAVVDRTGLPIGVAIATAERGDGWDNKDVTRTYAAQAPTEDSEATSRGVVDILAALQRSVDAAKAARKESTATEDSEAGR